jgi:cellulose synthase/poly-beta-1,6-N-acetylglucosamine synthase-like glycosyltransferase
LQKPFYLRVSFLSKLPIILLFAVFGLPVLLIQINYQIGLFFIAFYVSYWTVKVFESYFYVVKSYFDLLAYNRRSFHDDEIVHTHAALISHVVVVPIYTEPYDVIEENVEAILANDYPNMGSITILLATEARVPDAEVHALAIIRKFSTLSSVKIVNVVHPENLP